MKYLISFFLNSGQSTGHCFKTHQFDCRYSKLVLSDRMSFMVSSHRYAHHATGSWPTCEALYSAHLKPLTKLGTCGYSRYYLTYSNDRIWIVLNELFVCQKLRELIRGIYLCFDHWSRHYIQTRVFEYFLPLPKIEDTYVLIFGK